MIYGSKLKPYHFIGISLLIIAGSLISLSHLFTEAAIYADPVNPVPIYVPVMVSCLLPVIFSSFGMFSKFVFIYKKISP
jgi:hypothetical protein